MTPKAKNNDAALAAVASMAAAMSILHRIPSGQREAAANEALAIAMGILHGTCGPNGDFTSEPRPQPRQP